MKMDEERELHESPIVVSFFDVIFLNFLCDVPKYESEFKWEPLLQII